MNDGSARLFPSRAIARLMAEEEEAQLLPGVVNLHPGSQLVLDGQPVRVLVGGDTLVLLEGQEAKPVELSMETVARYVRDGTLVNAEPSVPAQSPPLRALSDRELIQANERADGRLGSPGVASPVAWSKPPREVLAHQAHRNLLVGRGLGPGSLGVRHLAQRPSLELTHLDISLLEHGARSIVDRR